MNSGGNNYADQQFAAKEAFVSEALPELAPRSVLDVGCNTGHFSFMAARSGASVVAIDYDPVVVGQVWRQARSEHLDVLPLVVNLARPSPAVGVVLVTEAYHMLRSEKCFRKEGLRVIPAPCGFRTLEFELQEFLPGEGDLS